MSRGRGPDGRDVGLRSGLLYPSRPMTDHYGPGGALHNGCTGTPTAPVYVTHIANHKHNNLSPSCRWKGTFCHAYIVIPARHRSHHYLVRSGCSSPRFYPNRTPGCGNSWCKKTFLAKTLVGSMLSRLIISVQSWIINGLRVPLKMGRSLTSHYGRFKRFVEPS